MNAAPSVLPAFAPALLLRPLLRPVPLSLFNHFVATVLRRLHRRYPGVEVRLRPMAGKTFLLAAAELPHPVRLEIVPRGQLVISSGKDAPADVRVYGTVAGLYGMLEGESDGDALFFSRALKVEGDTEALLTLRNALDSEALHLAEILLPSPLLPLAGKVRLPLRALHDALEQDMDCVSDALTGGLRKRCAALEGSLAAVQKENSTLRARLERMEKRAAKGQKGTAHEGA